MKPKAMVLRAAGTNCDMETAHALALAGAEPELVHVNQLINRRKFLKDYKILAIPGGFTYGDDIASGKILANELRYKLKDDLVKFIKRGALVIGICNGFQVLVKAGILPNISGDYETIEATLTLNDSAKFEDRWTYLQKTSTRVKTKCAWTTLADELIYLPVAHGEGKFIPRDEKIRRDLHALGLVVLKYTDAEGFPAAYPWNPNGSIDNIAGICDITGRVFGLMPHPERHIDRINHPRWTRLDPLAAGQGLKIFQSGVEFISKS